MFHFKDEISNQNTIKEEVVFSTWELNLGRLSTSTTLTRTLDSCIFKRDEEMIFFKVEKVRYFVAFM